MRPIGFSTGALAFADFLNGLAMLRDKHTTAVELSALREKELARLVDAFRSVWFASSMSRRHIGASQMSLFRPANVSLNFFEAPRVEEPVATMCVRE
jgi:hypothetical protein